MTVFKTLNEALDWVSANTVMGQRLAVLVRSDLPKTLAYEVVKGEWGCGYSYLGIWSSR